MSLGEQGVLNGTSRFVCCGQSDWQCLAERDGSGHLVASFTYAPGYIDAVARQERDLNSDDDFADDDEVVWYHSNTLYTVYALSDAGENVVERYRYDAYGGCTVLDADFSSDADNASDVENPYTFTARRLDAESGLMHYRFRYYSSALGRFVSPDPVGYTVSANLHVFVGNFPTMARDPFGLLEDEFFEDVEEWTWDDMKRHIDEADGVANIVTDLIKRNDKAALDSFLRRYKERLPQLSMKYPDGRLPAKYQLMNSNQVETYFEAIANTKNPNEWMTTLGKYSTAISLVGQAFNDMLQNGLLGWAQSDSCMNWYRAALEMGKDCDPATGNHRACRSHCLGLGNTGPHSTIVKCAEDICDKIAESGSIARNAGGTAQEAIEELGASMQTTCFKAARNLRRKGR